MAGEVHRTAASSDHHRQDPGSASGSIQHQNAGSDLWLQRQLGGVRAKPKPVSALAFDTTTLRFTKAAGIVVLTDELVRFSNPERRGLGAD